MRLSVAEAVSILAIGIAMVETPAGHRLLWQPSSPAPVIRADAGVAASAASQPVISRGEAQHP